MDFWDKNLEALKPVQPYLVEHLQTIKQEGNDTVTLGENISIGEAKDGNPILNVIVGGKEYCLNSRFRPISEAEKYASQFDDIKDYSVSLFFGFGNGTFAREILKKGNDKVRYCFFEPSRDSFMYMLHNEDLSDVFSDMRATFFVEGINKDETAAYLPTFIDWTNIPLTEIYVLPKYKDIFLQEYTDFVHIVRDIIVRAQLAMNTVVAHGNKLMRSSVLHLQYIFNCVNSTTVKGYFPEDMPAILVSAGPSIMNNIDVLREAKGKALIMCVDSAHRTLVKAGIKPDIVVSVDPAKYGLKKVYALDPNAFDGVAYLFNTVANCNRTANIDTYKRIIFDGDDDIVKHMFNEIGEQSITGYATGGSVACSAFSILEYWGFKTIIFVGQDLSFKDGKRYADSVRDAAEVSAEHGFTVFDVPGYYGDTVQTREDYYTYLKWFESAAYVTDCDNLINATEGGAYINGLTNMSLKDALDKYATKEYNIREIIENMPSAFNEEQQQQIENYIRSLPGRVEYFLRQFKEGISLAERGMTLSKRANPDMRELNKISKSLDKIDKATSNETEFAMISLRAVDVERRIARDQLVSGGNADNAEEQKEVFASLILLYRAFYDATLELKDIVNELMENFERDGRK